MRRALPVLLVLPSLLLAAQPDGGRVPPAPAVVSTAAEILVADEAFSQLDSSVASIGHSTLVAWTDGFRVKAQAFGRTLQPIGERLELIAGTAVTRLTLATNGDTYLLLGSAAGFPTLAWQISATGALLGGPHDTGVLSNEEASVRWNGEAYEMVFGEAVFNRRMLGERGTPIGPTERVAASELKNGFAPQWAVGEGRVVLSFFTVSSPCRIYCPTWVFTYTLYLVSADGQIVPQGTAGSGIYRGQGPAHAVANGPLGSLFVWGSQGTEWPGEAVVARRFDERGVTSDPLEGIQITRRDRLNTALHLFPAGRDFLLVYDQQARHQGRILVSDIEAVMISLESGAGAPFAIAADPEATELLDEAIVEADRLLVGYRVKGELGTKIMLRSQQMPAARQRGVRR